MKTFKMDNGSMYKCGAEGQPNRAGGQPNKAEGQPNKAGGYLSGRCSSLQAGAVTKAGSAEASSWLS